MNSNHCSCLLTYWKKHLFQNLTKLKHNGQFVGLCTFSTQNLSYKNAYRLSSISVVKNPVEKRNFSKSSFSLQNKNESADHETSDPMETNKVDIGEGTWEEVYSGVLTTQLKLLKMFSLSTSAIGLSVQPIIYEKVACANMALFLGFSSVVGIFTFVTPALIHWVAMKYVTKLEYDTESDIYVATTLSFFMKEKKIRFKIDEVIRPQVPGMFTSFLVKNRALFVDPSLFDNVNHYSRIMGYDKPIDYRLEPEKENKS